MTTDASPQAWVVGDRSQRDATKVVSDSTDQLLMADVNFTRAQPRAKDAGDPQAIELSSVFARDNSGLDSKLQKLESEAYKYYGSQDRKIFDVRSGAYAGMRVPEALRCAIFQSNLAVKAGLISPSEVTVRAIEFGHLMQRKGFKQETFVPGRSYPDGTYIVGANGGAEGNRNHVGLVLNGKLMHTNGGRILYESVGNRFPAGAFPQMRVYIPPAARTRAT